MRKGLFESSRKVIPRGLPQVEGLILQLIKTDPDPEMALEELQNRILYRPEYFPEDRIAELTETNDPEKVAFLLIRDNDLGKLENLGEQFQDLNEMDSPVEMMKVIPTMDAFLRRLQ